MLEAGHPDHVILRLPRYMLQEGKLCVRICVVVLEAIMLGLENICAALEAG